MDIDLSLDRLPLPSLEVYVLLSLLAASGSVYYLWTEAALFLHMLGIQGSLDPPFDLFARIPPSLGGVMGNGTQAAPSVTWQAVHWASQQPHCLWPLVNLVYCVLLVGSVWVQRSVFGELRSCETASLRDHLWQLLFYKVVFVFGVVNVQELEHALGWTFFISLLVVLHLARQLARDRHSYLILTNNWSLEGQIRRRRILLLLFFIFFVSIGLFLGVCVWYFSSAPETALTYDFDEQHALLRKNSASSPYDFNLGLHSTLFMLCEVGLLVVQTFHALSICVFDQLTLSYALTLDPEQTETESETEDEARPRRNARDDVHAAMTHSIDFYFDLAALLFDLLHHVHMLVCCNLFLSMTSLIVSLQMRARVRQIHGILKKRHSVTWLSHHIDLYPDLTVAREEEDAENNCAICWESVRTGSPKVLPCRHAFHTACLRKWLVVSMNCPTCRLSLQTDREVDKGRRIPRRLYNPRDNGFWGFLQTGQTLLDLFGGWDPQSEDGFPTVLSPPRPSLFAEFAVPDWNVPTASTRSDAPSSTAQKRPEVRVRGQS